MDLINVITLEGVVFEPPSSDVYGKISRQYVPLLHVNNHNQFLFKAVAYTAYATKKILDLNVGDIISVIGRIHIRESDTSNIITIEASDIRIWDSDSEYGKSIIKKSKYSSLLTRDKLKLPWD